MSISSRKKIAEAIRSIPGKKAMLRDALESLQPYSSSLPTLALPWKDLEHHFAAIERSIDERFKALQYHIKGDGEGSDEEEDQPADAKAEAEGDDGEATPRPELRSFCANMDALGLLSYRIDNRKDYVAITKELAPALRCAPDPALLVLDSVELFYPKYAPSSYHRRSFDIVVTRKACIDLLETLHSISPAIRPYVRDRAKMLAVHWRSKIPTSGNFYLEALGFLQLIAAYDLVPVFPVDDVMELFTSVSRGKLAVDLIKNLGLTDKLPDLIQKLKSKCKQLDAVKLICAFNMADKFPPVPLLTFYMNEARNIGQKLRMKRNNALQAQHEAFSKEIDAVKAVLEVVEEYKLDAEHHLGEKLVKRIARLEASVKKIAELKQEKADKKRMAASAAASESEHQQLMQPNKQPRRPSSCTSADANAAITNPSLTQTHPRIESADRALYIAGAGLSGLAATGSVYTHGFSNNAGGAMSHGAIHGPPKSYHSSETLVGTGSMYDRPVTNIGYTSSGLPLSYGSSPYT